MRALIIEDTVKIASLIRDELENQGFEVEESWDGREGSAKVAESDYDVIILDLMLPGKDGLTILSELRAAGKKTPVLVLTARGEVSDRVQGLELGADDYLSKPFAADELVARVKALLRRTGAQANPVSKVGDLKIDYVAQTVFRGSRPLDLTRREFKLLEFLMRTPGQVVTRGQIHEGVWGYNFDPGTNLVDVYIQRLRRKVDDNEEVRLIQTVRGAGYMVGIQ